MTRSARPTGDVTGDAATGNVAGETVFSRVLVTQDDELDQVLILAHSALGLPLAQLAHDLKVDRRDLEARVARILTQLRQDGGLSAQLSGFRQAGKVEDYYPVIARLGLQSWFCARPGCANPIVQPATGRPRKTCGSKCRHLLSKANGISWKDGYRERPSAGSTMAGAEGDATQDATATRDALIQLMKPINFPRQRTDWISPTIRCRDRALLLLGFTCPAPVTPSDLGALDIHDIGETLKGFEVRLYKRTSRATRYITMQSSNDRELCAVQALQSWRQLLARSGRTTGPLFMRLERNGQLPDNSIQLSGRAVTRVARDALWNGGSIRSPDSPDFGASTLFSDFLKTLMRDTYFLEAVTSASRANQPFALGAGEEP
jgi:hypothetical protein